MAMVTLQSNVPKFLSELGSKVKQEAFNAAVEVYNVSQVRCPVKTGFLVRSIYDKQIPNGYEVGFTAQYAGIVDYRREYFRSAILEVEPLYYNKMVTGVNAVINNQK